MRSLPNKVNINQCGLLVHGVFEGASEGLRSLFELSGIDGLPSGYGRFKKIWEERLKTRQEARALGSGYSELGLDYSNRISLSQVWFGYKFTSCYLRYWGASPRRPDNLTFIINPQYVKEHRKDFKHKSPIGHLLTGFDSWDEIQTKKSIPRKEGIIGIIVHPAQFELVRDWMLELTLEHPEERIPIYDFNGNVLFDPSTSAEENASIILESPLLNEGIMKDSKTPVIHKTDYRFLHPAEITNRLERIERLIEVGVIGGRFGSRSLEAKQKIDKLLQRFKTEITNMSEYSNYGFKAQNEEVIELLIALSNNEVSMPISPTPVTSSRR